MMCRMLDAAAAVESLPSSLTAFRESIFAGEMLFLLPDCLQKCSYNV